MKSTRSACVVRWATGAVVIAVRSRPLTPSATSAAAGPSAYADPFLRLGIGFSKNYFTYNTGGAVNGGRPPRAASNVVTEAVFDALGLKRTA